MLFRLVWLVINGRELDFPRTSRLVGKPKYRRLQISSSLVVRVVEKARRARNNRAARIFPGPDDARRIFFQLTYSLQD